MTEQEKIELIVHIKSVIAQYESDSYKFLLSEKAYRIALTSLTAPAAVPVDLLPDEGELERLYSIYCTPTVGSKNAIRHIRKEMLRRLEGMK